MNEKLVYVSIAVVVALGIVAFAYVTQPACTNPTQTQVKFCGGDLNAIKSALSGRQLSIQALYPDESTSSPCELKAWLEVTAAASRAGGQPRVYANINNEYCLESADNSTPRTACPKADVLLKHGECNCIKTIAAEKRVEIEGSEDFFCNNSAKIGAAIAAALAS
ncbi:MAG: hypothetical protein ACP5O3_00715 [Candidatus Micrarchaeia archaeon]|jgi:hypothetical protein